MPRCEGLPSGPCPKGANDKFVKNTQGDLFLCRSCEEVRFPSAPKAKSSSYTRSGNPISNPLPQSAQVLTLQDVQCAGCDRMCSRATSVQCDICAAVFDQQCSTLPVEVFTTLLTIIKCCGWVCYNCRTTCRS